MMMNTVTTVVLVTAALVTMANGQNDELTSIVLFGETGTGKSTLGNTLVGTKVFSESAGVDAHTFETTSNDGYHLQQKIRVFDTPGLGEVNADAEKMHLVNMAKKITGDDSVQAFAILLEYPNHRFEDREKWLIDQIIKMFPDSPWYEHVAIVWTHYYNFLPQEMKNERDSRMRDVQDKLIHFFGSEVSPDKLKSIPHFFFDSIDAREQGSESQAEVGKLVEWAKNCKRFKEDMPTMRVPDGPPRTETRERTENGEIRTEIIEGPHKYFGLFGPREEYPIRLQKKIKIIEQRLVQSMSDGTNDNSEWKEVRRDEWWVEI